MEIKINDKTTKTSATTLMELASELTLPENGVAMALDNKMIKRDQWTNTPLTNGSEVIIIKAACGG
ncbi:MAG: sulfur carrier protein ThiS [Prevotella sp.]|nr:sulfur carrier protein ThiS [Prevotella sp.]